MKRKQSNQLQLAVTGSRGSIAATAFFSMFINILMLAGPLYMLQVYDRVLVSNSVETLVALSVMILGLFVAMGLLEFTRTRILARVATQLEARTAPAVFDASVRKRLVETHDDGGQGLNDLTLVRDFVSSNALPAFFDLPWVPIYILILALLHPVLGLLGIGGIVFLVAVSWLNNATTRGPMAKYAEAIAPGRAVAQASESSAQVMHAMGMTRQVRRVWIDIHNRAELHRIRATDRSGGFGVLSKTSRIILQSAALGVGAALVIAGEFTAGSMIAGTIILGRGLAPVDQSIAHWRSYVAAKGAYARLKALLDQYPEPQQRLSQPTPYRRIDAERIFAGPPGAMKAVVFEINFQLGAGEALAILGPSASGKSTLARLLAGVWLPQAGHIRLDGAAFEQWNADEIGAHIGYLPQDIELIEGTVAQNIARFQPDATDMEIVAAAEAAGVHDIVLELVDGYETNVGVGGRALSGGQRQRIALARTLFRDPFLVVLDEPNSNLDSEGDDALATALQSIKARGGIAVVVSHRPGIVNAVDKVLVLQDGRQRAFGPRADVLAQTTQPKQVQIPTNVTPLAQRAI